MATNMRTRREAARSLYDEIRRELPNASVYIVRRSGSDFWNITFRGMKRDEDFKEYIEEPTDIYSRFNSLPKDIRDVYEDINIGPEDYNWLPDSLKDVNEQCMQNN